MSFSIYWTAYFQFYVLKTAYAMKRFNIFYCYFIILLTFSMIYLSHAQIKFIKTMDGERFHENSVPSIYLNEFK